MNRALRKVVLDDQKYYAAVVRMRERISPFPSRYRGTYEIFAPGPNPSNTGLESLLISASTTVMSVLIPTLRLFPGGNDGQMFLSLTVHVPSGSPVTISDLFAEPSRGLRVLAEAFRKRVVRANSCVRKSLQSPITGDLAERGFDPTAGNYRHFALTVRGLAIGFPLGQVAAPVCNSVEATVPYAVLRPYLSRLGKKLVAGVRPPLFRPKAKS